MASAPPSALARFAVSRVCLFFACHNPWFLVLIDGWVPPPLSSQPQKAGLGGSGQSRAARMTLWVGADVPCRWCYCRGPAALIRLACIDTVLYLYCIGDS